MIFSIRDLSFELGSMLLEGWPAFAARAVCALLILLAAWLVRRWLTHKGFPALEARSWHFTGTPILLRSFAVPVQRMCTVVGIYLAASSLPGHSRCAQAVPNGIPAGHDPVDVRGPVCSF